MPRTSTLAPPANESSASLLGYNIKRLRMASGMTQLQLARELAPLRHSDAESVRCQIANFERGQAASRTGIDWLDSFCHVFGVTPAELFASPEAHCGSFLQEGI